MTEQGRPRRPAYSDGCRSRHFAGSCPPPNELLFFLACSRRPLRRFAPPPPLRRGGSPAPKWKNEAAARGTRAEENHFGGNSDSEAAARAGKSTTLLRAPDPPPFMGEGDHAKHGGGGCRGEPSHRNVLRRSIPGRSPKPATSSRRRRASAGDVAGSADTGWAPTRLRRDARRRAMASAGRTGWCGQGRSCPHRRC